MSAFDHVAPAIEKWLAGSKRSLVVGICGAQGSGKSTLSRHLAGHFAKRGLKVAVLSLDDLYLSRERRSHLAETVHPLFATRGVPGTHDIALGEHVLDALRSGQPLRLPRFDKASDQPLPESNWPVVEAPDLILFEGWCVGAAPQHDYELMQPVNAFEASMDPQRIWRRHVNAALKGPYQRLFDRIDRLILLAAPDFDAVTHWRTEAEHELRAQLKREGRMGTRVMTDAEILRFVRHYERLTQHILAEMPKRADLILWLDAGRRIVRSHFA